MQKLSDDKNLKIASLASLLLFGLLGVAFLRSSYQTIPSNIFNGMMFLIFVFVVAYVIKIIKKPQIVEVAKQVDSKSDIADNKSNPLESKISSKPISSSNLKVGFDSVIGIDFVKDELLEIIDFIKNPKKYRDLGIILPKGVLLVGPPGVGKTLIAKALAKEANVPFFYQSGASFNQIYVGMGSKKVQDIFAQAKKNAPSIIFIDEIDSIGKKRGESDERDSTLNQLLTEMDGFIDSSGVILMGATNRVDILDDALLRSGRFDRRVYLDLPNLEDRVKIIKHYIKSKKHTLDISKLSEEIVGFSGASIATLINEALLSMLKRGSKSLDYIDISNVKDRVIFGKKSKFITREEKEILSLYNSSKAYIAKDINYKIDKFSLHSEYLDSNITHNILSKDDIINLIKYYLIGHISCENIYNQKYSIAKDDIFQAKELAKKLVYEYGMSNCFLCNDNEVERVLQEIVASLKNEIDFIELKRVSLLMYKNEYLLRNEFN